MQFEIFLVSVQYVSERRFRSLENQIKLSCQNPCYVVRLEHDGAGLFNALDQALEEGAAQICLRPLGLPFSESLRRWIPNAAGDWLAGHREAGVKLTIAKDLDKDEALIQFIANSAVEDEEILPNAGGVNGKGWDRPPNFEHHLLVCTGPRCHVRGSVNLLSSLKTEVQKAGIGSKCLIANMGCLYPCNNGPIVVHYPKGDWYKISSSEDISSFVQEVLIAGKPSDLLLPFQSHQKTYGEKHV